MGLITRRDWLKGSAAFAGAMCVGRRTKAADQKPRRLLFFTKSSGYQHSVIQRHGNELAYAEKLLIAMGRQNDLEIIPSKDGRLFTPQSLARFDGFIFFTTGDLTQPGSDQHPPMPADGKQALLDAIAAGKGFVGIHSASDTFHSQGDQIDPYIEMLGGEFLTHGSQQPSISHVIDRNFPGVPLRDFTLAEEWYVLKNFAPDSNVILSQDTLGMKGTMYQRDTYPSTWARHYGKGGVFYTSLGHREDTWINPIFTQLLMGGMCWATNLATASIP